MAATIASTRPSVARKLAHPFVTHSAPFNWAGGLQTAVPMAAPLVGGHIFDWPLLDTSAAMVGAIIIGIGSAMLPTRHRSIHYLLMTLFATGLFWGWLQIPHTLESHIPLGMLAAVLWVTAFVLAGSSFMPYLASAGFMMVLYYMLPISPGTVRWVFAGAAGAALFCWIVDRFTAKPQSTRSTIAILFDHLATLYSTIASPHVDERELHALVKIGRSLQQLTGPIERNPHLNLSDRKLAMAASSAIDSAAIMVETRLLLERGVTTAETLPSTELHAIGEAFAGFAATLKRGDLPELSTLPQSGPASHHSNTLLELSDIRAVSDRIITRLQEWNSPANIPTDAPSIAQRLKSGYTPGSLMLRHLARFVVAMGISGVISWSLGDDTVFRKDSHWMALGLFVALQPGYNATVIKGLQRAVGSLFGGVLCFALVAVLPEHFWFGYLLPLLAFVGMGFTMTNYTWMAIAITPLVVIGFGNTDMHYDVLAARILYTAAGCLLAVLVRVVLWPSWKRDELPEIAARALTAQSAFFEQLKQSLTIEAPSPEKARALLDSGRAARIALDGLAEAQRHMLTEPLSAAGHEIDAMVPLIEDLRRMSFSLVVHAHQAGDDQRERTIANIEVIENALAQASQRIEQIAGEGETQTSPIFDFRPSRSETARERIARVEAEIAALAPIARFIRERVDALKLDPITA